MILATHHTFQALSQNLKLLSILCSMYSFCQQILRCEYTSYMPTSSYAAWADAMPSHNATLA